MKLNAHHRNAELIASLTLQALPGTHRIDLTNTPTDHATATTARALTELTTDGIIRTKRNRNGTRIQAHQLTTLGLAWWQGRTTLPVPRLVDDTWQWWTPNLSTDDLEPAEDGGLIFTPSTDLTELPDI